jgi:hypothetical protein
MFALLALVSALGGSCLLFLGERIAGPGVAARPVLSGIGAALVAVALIIRIVSVVRARPAERKVLALPAAAYLSMLVGVGLYALQIDGGPVAADSDLATILAVVWPIGWAAGAIPALMMELSLRRMEGASRIEDRRVISLGSGGLIIALATSWLFVINWVATDKDQSWDTRAIKEVSASGLTRTMVKSQTETVTATLFFPASNEVGETVEPYFQALAKENPLFVVERTDAESNPGRAKELRARGNATVVLHRGTNRQSIALDLEPAKARTKLKKFDTDVQSKLAKLTVKDRFVYVVTGHGERSTRPRDTDPPGLRDTSEVLKRLGYRVKSITTTDGLTKAIPKDATFVLLAAPSSALLDSEVATLRTYVRGGGSLWVMVDPDSEEDPQIGGLLGDLGVNVDRTPLAHEATYVALTGAKVDRRNVVSNRFTSHGSTAVLSKVSGRGILWFSGAGALRKAEGSDADVTFTVKSFSGTYADANGDLAYDKSEKKSIFNLVAAVQLPGSNGERGGRALVVGDADVISDKLMRHNLVNQQFLVDSIQWLEGNEAAASEVPDIEDTAIVHTRNEDQAWFWGMIVGMPLLILIVGPITRRFLRGEWRAS